ncbi:MAG: sugar transferase [Aureliella sp.]
MFTWLTTRSWSRNSSWTPLLQTQREFQRTLSKERSRVDRNGSCFGFIILRLESLRNARRQTVQLGKLLHRRLRDTDEKGHLGLGRIGVLLPETDSLETDLVVNQIVKLAGEWNLRVETEAFVYPEDGGRNLPSSDEHDDESRHGGEKIATPAASGELVGEGVRSRQAVGIVSSSREATAPLAMMLPSYPAWKRLLDVFGAVIGLTLSAPIMAVAVVLVKMTSRGPVFFTQSRTGFLGQPFEIYKIRTMVVNAEALKADLEASNERDGPAFKMRHDPRITLIGRLLRATGLDELPQLYNVLRGDMALVGPRPLPVSEADQCSAWQKRRQEVKPGLTCFWQISKSRQISFADWMRLDLSYARGFTPWLDVKLIARTAASVFLGRVGH